MILREVEDYCDTTNTDWESTINSSSYTNKIILIDELHTHMTELLTAYITYKDNTTKQMFVNVIMALYHYLFNKHLITTDDPDIPPIGDVDIDSINLYKNWTYIFPDNSSLFSLEPDETDSTLGVLKTSPVTPSPDTPPIFDELKTSIESVFNNDDIETIRQTTMDIASASLDFNSYRVFKQPVVKTISNTDIKQLLLSDYNIQTVCEEFNWTIPGFYPE